MLASWAVRAAETNAIQANLDIRDGCFLEEVSRFINKTPLKTIVIRSALHDMTNYIALLKHLCQPKKMQTNQLNLNEIYLYNPISADHKKW